MKTTLKTAEKVVNKSVVPLPFAQVAHLARALNNNIVMISHVLQFMYLNLYKRMILIISLLEHVVKETLDHMINQTTEQQKDIC